MKERGHNPRSTMFAMDVLHIVIGLLIVVLAVITFLNAEENIVLFPVIFFLAAFLNIVSGVVKIRTALRRRKRILSGAAFILFGVVLLALCAVSGISIWRG